MNNELLAILDYLERDRGIERDVLKSVIENALCGAARKAIGPANELRVDLNPTTGDIKALAKLKVVERVVDPHAEIDILRVRGQFPDVKVGDEIDWEVTPENFGRISAQNAKQAIMQQLKQAEREKVSVEYDDRIGEVIFGAITRFDRGDIILSLGRAEAVLRHQDRVPSEDYQIGDHICCVLTAVDPERPGPILCASRSTPQLVIRLFEREVAEIAEGIVEIKGVAREPGYRSKIAVFSKDPKVDPVGACVGVRGSRVKTIVRELNGEKVDIVRWDPELTTYISNALQPAKIREVVVDEDSQSVTILVDQDQLSLAIGKRGQNARLTVKLTGWKVDIQKLEDQQEVNFEEKIRQAIENLAKHDFIGEENATLLVQNGFLTLDGITAAEEDDIAAIEGIDEDTAKSIKEAAAAATEESAG
jgi:N utilization substance protein A